MVFEGSIPTCTCFHSENFLCDFCLYISVCRSITECFTHASKELSFVHCGPVWNQCCHVSRMWLHRKLQVWGHLYKARAFTHCFSLVLRIPSFCKNENLHTAVENLFQPLAFFGVGEGRLVCVVKYRGLGLYCNKQCCTAGKIHHVYLTERLRVLLTASNSRRCIACTYLIQPSLMSAGFPMKYTPPSNSSRSV